jgi:hypothetical protein
MLGLNFAGVIRRYSSLCWRFVYVCLFVCLMTLVVARDAASNGGMIV